MSEHNLEVILVNLISYDYLVRYQAPLPTNTLAGYLKTSMPKVKVTVIDMQKLFSQNENVGSDKETIFNQAISCTIQEIKCSSQNTPVIVGLSMKWTTQEVASIIIKQVTKSVDNNRVLFTLGNIMSTYGYQYLLENPEFQNTLAVVGEGERALVKIVQKALENLHNITNLSLYLGIANVAVRYDDKIFLEKLERVDLTQYPNLTIPTAIDIYDKEWDVYAIETSRGCPWGRCTFCSIKDQFGRCLNSNQKTDWGWKPFSLDKIFNDVQNYINQGAIRFDVKDSEFFGPVRKEGNTDHFESSMNRVAQFANQFGEFNKKFGATISHVSARVDTVVREQEILKNVRRRQVYEQLSQSGLIGLYLGIESGSKRQLRLYGKGVTVEENRQAIKILRELGFNLEVGFIFFSPLDVMEDLYNNISFIGETRLHETDSRIFGSLRVQEGTTYAEMLRKRNLLGKPQRRSLSYSYRYQDDEVYFIKKTFDTWEKATIKLVRLLPKAVRLESYEMNFFFLQDVLRGYFSGGRDNVKRVVMEHVKKRGTYLGGISDTGGSLSAYLSQAKVANSNLLK